MDKKSKIIWGLFILSSLILSFDAFFILVDTKCPHFFEKFKLYFPAFIIFIHIFTVLKTKKALFFITISSLTGLIFEIVGTHFGNIVKASYYYSNNYYDIFIFGIPLLIPIFWTIFIYTAYSITNSFLLWKGIEKPSVITSDKSTPVKALYKLILLDAFIVLSIDLFMDPILVNLGNWQWQDTGFYFDIPTLNFIGWFTIALIISTIFRSVEYYYPIKIKLHYSMFLIPLAGYFSLYLIFTIMAYSAKLYLLIAINSVIIPPIIILNIKDFFKYKKISVQQT